MKLKRESPAGTRGGRPRGTGVQWAAVFAAVRAEGGEWCRLPKEYASQPSALSSARAAQAVHSAFDIELTTRKVKGKGVIYARQKTA